jgi:endonuclease/exonuclease/phosphatase family metal-dependent hydrolase
MPILNVATLNIWNRSGPWEERLVAIRTHLRELSPDLLGLQEVIVTEMGDRLDQGKSVAEGLGYEVAFGASHGEGYAFGNALLSRWPIASSKVFLLPSEDPEDHRSLLYAEIDSPYGMIPVFVTHLSWRLHEGHVRQVQVRTIAARVQELAKMHGFPPIIVGDFNAEPDADEIRFMRGLTGLGGRCVYFADAFGLAGGGAAGATFSKKNPFAEVLREPERRIDYIFVRGPDAQRRGEPLGARVCFDTAVDGVLPSDHYGVIATLSA